MGKIGKAVITAAGSGSRLLPFSKEMPKEMLPYCARAADGRLILKPILEAAYESLYDHGCREFCFVVGRGKRSIEDHFLADGSAKHLANSDLQDLYRRIRLSNIEYVQQSSPLGFGAAVLRAKSFAGGSSFLLHAGDDAILSPDNSHLRRLEDAFLSSGADVAFLVDRVERPEEYGVVEGTSIGEGVLRVERLEEKPKRPRSNLAVVSAYAFRPSIFYELERAERDGNGELDITDAISPAVARGKCVAVMLEAGEKRIDVGTPENYAACIRDSLEYSGRDAGGASRGIGGRVCSPAQRPLPACRRYRARRPGSILMRGWPTRGIPRNIQAPLRAAVGRPRNLAQGAVEPAGAPASSLVAGRRARRIHPQILGPYGCGMPRGWAP